MLYKYIHVFEPPTELDIPLDCIELMPINLFLFSGLHGLFHNLQNIDNIMNFCEQCSLSNVASISVNNLKTPTFEIKHNVNIVLYHCKTKGCSSIWYVCDGTCSFVQKRYSENRRYSRKDTFIRHMKQHHKSQILDPTSIKAVREDNVSDSMEIDFQNLFGEFVDDIDHVPNHDSNYAFDYIPPTEVIKQKFINSHLNEYLQLVKLNCYFPAVSRLVCRAEFSCKHTGSQQADLGQIPAAWVRLFLNIAVLVTGMSKSSQMVLSEIITFVLTFVPKSVQTKT